MRPYSSEFARRLLVVGWFACFLVNLGMLLFFYVDGWILQDNFRAGLTQLSALYAPYLGAILAFYFSSRMKTPNAGDSAGTAFLLAGVGSIVWNVMIVGLMARVLLFDGTIEGTIRDMLFFGSTLSWLVAPAIGFYFGNPSLPESGSLSVPAGKKINES
jgi:hypothetical protein